jgi:hypothetical protein
VISSSMTCPLLITATLEVSCSDGVKLSYSRDRILRHMEGVVAWLQDSRFREIVFVKNCALKILSEVLVKAAEAYGKRLEFVQVDASRPTAWQGKGYDEGDMVRKALQSSAVLASAERFCKVTGKLFYECDPLFEVHDRQGIIYMERVYPAGRLIGFRKLLGVFYRSRRLAWVLPFLKKSLGVPWLVVKAASDYHVDTRFYHVSKKFYCSNLLESHKRVQDALGYPLEAAFYDELKNSLECSFLMKRPKNYGHSEIINSFPEIICREAMELSQAIIK